MKRHRVTRVFHNPSLTGLAEEHRGIVYSRAGGQDLEMTLLTPLCSQEKGAPALPVVVFVQGSAWTSPNMGYAIPQLSEYAREGLAVASICHRSSTDGFAFPAYLQDLKAAIRYLRLSADDLGIDPHRLGVFGTSSGGNAALLAGLTGDDSRYSTPEHAGYSDAVRAVVSCFGPTDLKSLFSLNPEAFLEDPVFKGLTQGKDPEEVMREMSPLMQIKAGRKLPAFLLAHGDRDDLVPYKQSEAMYRALLAAGVDAQLIKVVGAPHEGSFWSANLHRRIRRFLMSRL